MQTILVTGGCGFIGSHTSYLLVKKGYQVIVIDSNINSSEKVVENIHLLFKKEKILNNLIFIKGDIRDERLLEQIFTNAQKANQPISCVMHFAGLKSVSESLSNPLKYWDMNLSGTISLLRLMDKYECRNIVFSSSATVYATNCSDLLKEISPISPCNPYGRTKIVIESLLKDIYDNTKNTWRIANLRYFNPVGAHESGLLGEDPVGIPNNVFPILNQVAIGKLLKMKIFGNDWPTHDGTGVRDYVHVMDLAEGHIKAMEYLGNNSAQILNLNLGTGKGTSVLELIRIFETVNNVKINYEFTSRRKGDHAVVIADNSLAKNLLDWYPKRNIEDMCKDGWNWQFKNPDGF